MADRRQRRAFWRWVAVLACSQYMAAPVDARAQAEAGDGEIACLPVDLPADHWGVEAVRRLEALGLRRVQAPTALIDGCLLVDALDADAAGFGLAADWRRLFEEEYAAPPRATSAVVFGAAEVGVAIERDATDPGRGEFPPDRTGAIAGRSGSGALGSVEGVVGVGGRMWAATRGAFLRDEVRLDRMEFGAVLGPVDLTVGRGAAAFGQARSGAVVLSRATSLDRLQLETRAPFRLPGPLARAGTITVSTFLSRLSGPRHADEPWFWGARGTLRPHERLTFAANRAAMFGGDGVPITAENLLSLLIGDVTGIGFENQVVSLEGRWRMPTEEILPVTAYFEWGAEDAAGAWWDVPGRIFGLYVPAVPGAAHTSVTLEYADFAASCCGNPEWYRHWSFPGSWVIGDEPLGHPLGGNGSELFLRLSSHLAAARLRLTADILTRDRGGENLYVPGRAGRSYGTVVRSRWRVRPRVDLSASGSVEDGHGWTERSLHLSGTIHLEP